MIHLSPLPQLCAERIKLQRNKKVLTYQAEVRKKVLLSTYGDIFQQSGNSLGVKELQTSLQTEFSGVQAKYHPAVNYLIMLIIKNEIK